MKYKVVFTNSIEDFYYETSCEQHFEGFESALLWLDQIMEANLESYVFNIAENFRWYLPGCNVSGIVDASDTDSYVECFLNINLTDETGYNYGYNGMDGIIGWNIPYEINNVGDVILNPCDPYLIDGWMQYFGQTEDTISMRDAYNLIIQHFPDVQKS